MLARSSNALASEEGRRETSKSWMVFAVHSKVEDKMRSVTCLSHASNSIKYLGVSILGY